MIPRRQSPRRDGKEEKSKPGESTVLWLEAFKVLPQIAWVVAGTWLLLAFSGPLLRTLEQGTITKVGIGVLQIEVAQKQIQQAAIAQKQEIPKNLKARIERTPRILFDAAVLWLDDNPAKNVAERRALASLGMTVDTARTTAEALTMLSVGRYQIIISDLSRKEPDALPCPQPEKAEDPTRCDLIGYLNREFEKNNRGKETERTQPPVIFYSSFFLPQDGAPPFSFGATSRVDELFHLVLDALDRRDIQPADAHRSR